LATISLTFGEPLARRQAIQWPLVELATEAQMLQALTRRTAAELDTRGHLEISDRVAMCNYRANRFCCEAADRAKQVHGGLGYRRHKPFEHIYRHHRATASPNLASRTFVNASLTDNDRAPVSPTDGGKEAVKVLYARVKKASTLAPDRATALSVFMVLARQGPIRAAVKDC
jgi:hypothetical protein